MKKILSIMLAVVMVFTAVPASAFASGDVAKEEKATITIYGDGKDTPSMCNALFAENVDVEIKEDTATVKVYIAYPVPAFAAMGQDGTVKDFVITYGDKEYKGVSDIESKPEMTPREDNKMFGLSKDKKVTAQVVTFQLPKEALKAERLDGKAFINVMMNKEIAFDLAIKVPEQPEAPKYFLEDGNHYVDFDLWSATADKISMGDGAFNDYPKALATVKEGKVVKIQFATNPIDMMGIRSAVTKMNVEGTAATILEKGKYTTGDNKQQEYMLRGEFEMPAKAIPATAADITYVNIAMFVPGTPMGDRPIDARFKFNWSTATKTDDANIVVTKAEVKPEEKPEIVLPKAPSKVVSNLATTKGGYNDIVTKWTKVKNATGYTVYSKKATAKKWNLLGKTTKTSFLKKDLNNGTKYQFKVVPYVTVDGKTYASKGYKISTATTLNKVKAPTIKRVNKTQVKVSWNNILGETGYQISKSKKANSVNVIKTVNTTTGKSTVVKTPKNSKYFYKVRAYKVVDGKKVFAPWSNAKAFAK